MKKYVTRTLEMVAITTLALLIIVVSARSAKPRFSLTLRPHTQCECTVGGNVDVDAVITNQTTHNITIYGGRAGANVSTDVMVLVYQKDGVKLPLNEFGQAIYGLPNHLGMVVAVNGTEITLKSHESYTEVVNLSEIYNIEVAGKYVVQLKKRFGDNSSDYVESEFQSIDVN